ncbi:conserved Plasmodium protein, unknown function [Plasmodium ovale wallikeri]|uniref:Ribosomal RNA-processing protein 12-like conserved domain-containing protein n=1 Tax=Plasmodium ovale wallikeri TaxID=864142 RepID=A0A1A8YVL2_PLAOA|nr:conserved Plasmodium protein, unknown function [Plasmodium ovale wallikeri]
MDKFKKCKKRKFRSLRGAKQCLKKKNTHLKESKSKFLPSIFIKNLILKYLSEKKNGVQVYDEKNNTQGRTCDSTSEHFGDEKETENLKERLFFGKNEIVERDLVKNCLIFDKDETLRIISYKILFDVMKKCIDHEHVLMKIEEMGFPVEDIKGKDNEDLHICSKYKADTFLTYIFKNLKIVKVTKNFQALQKIMNVIKSIALITPYIYKVKFLFYFCSIFNIYQKENRRGISERMEVVKRGDPQIGGDAQQRYSSSIFTNADDEDQFVDLFFDIMNDFVSMNNNYNTYDDVYTFYSYFVLRWMLIYFTNKASFFSKGKVHPVTVSKYMMLLLSVLRHLHESTDCDMVKLLRWEDEKRHAHPRGNEIGQSEGVVGYLEEKEKEEEEEEEEKKNKKKELGKDYVGYAVGEEELTFGIKCKGRENDSQEKEKEKIPLFDDWEGTQVIGENLLNYMSSRQNVKNEKIRREKNEIKNMIEQFYGKVDLNIEKNLDDMKDNINNLTQRTFMTVYNLFSKINIVHKHIVLLYFSQSFLKIASFEYSYHVIFNCFQLLNKLLTVENFVLHPLIFLTVEKVLTFYENVIIYLYKKKDHFSGEFSHFCDQFNSKHRGVYENVFTRIWNLYLLIISDEYSKRELIKDSHNKYFNIYPDGEQMGLNTFNTLMTVLKVNNIEFSNECKDFILTNIDKNYKRELTNCLSTSFRVIGFGFFIEESFFFTQNELLSKDIFILNRMLKDTNKTFFGGNFKVLINFFYPLLICYIGLYQKEEHYSIKKKHFQTYIKNLLKHFVSSLNDCINLYYFLSTQIEDMYILVTKFMDCNDYTLLTLFIHFFERFYLSTIKMNEKLKISSSVLMNIDRRKDIKCKYTNINLRKNNFFLNNISDNLLKIFLPKFISILTLSFTQKFLSPHMGKENNLPMQRTIEGFTKLIHACLHFSSSINCSDILLILEDIITKKEIEKEIFSLLSLLTVIKIFIPFFTPDQLNMCSIYYRKLVSLISAVLRKMFSTYKLVRNEYSSTVCCDNNFEHTSENGRENINREETNYNAQNNNEGDNSHVYQSNGSHVGTTSDYPEGVFILPNKDKPNGCYGSNAHGGGDVHKEECKNDAVGSRVLSVKSTIRKRRKRSGRKKNAEDGLNKQMDKDKCRKNNGIVKGEKKKKKKKKKKKNTRKGNNNGEKEEGNRKKIIQDMKFELEKFKYARVLVYDSVAVLFNYIGNIFLKRRKEIYPHSYKNKKRSSNVSRSTSYKNIPYLRPIEEQILHNIIVDDKLEERELPIMMTKENILNFFEHISYYNINKYIKKYFVYINSLMLYLKECKYVDRCYCYDMFNSLFPILIKSMFYINKKFTTKTKKHSLFDSVIEIGISNVEFLILNVTPGLVVDDINCRKIVLHFFHLLVKKYTLEKKNQEQLFTLCLKISFECTSNMLKVFLKFLLTCVNLFNREVILKNVKELMKLLDSISHKKVYVYIVERFFLKLDELLQWRKREEHNKSGADENEEGKEGEKNDEGEESAEGGEHSLLKYLSKPGRRIFHKLVRKQQRNRKPSNNNNDDNNGGDNRLWGDKNERGVKRAPYGYGTQTSLDNYSSSASYGEEVSSNESSNESSDSSYSAGSPESSAEKEDAELHLTDDEGSHLKGNISGNHTKNDLTKLRNKEEHKRKRAQLHRKDARRNNKRKNESTNLVQFFEKAKKHLGQKESNFMQTTLTQILQKEKKKKVKGKLDENVGYILDNLENLILQGKQNWNIPVKNKRVITDLFGEKYFMKQKIRKEEKKEKEDSFSSNSDDENNVEVRNDGKIIIHNADLHSIKEKEKRKYDVTNKKYSCIYEKHNMHAKFKLMNKLKNKNKNKNNNKFVTADKMLYKSKKGEGDIIKKDKMLPYSYVALKPIMTKEKFRARTLHAFKHIKGSTKRRGKRKMGVNRQN